MKYAVHLFPSVRVKVTGIEADSPQQAVEKAEAALNLHEVLDNRSPSAQNVEHVEWDESAPAIALADPLNEHGAVLYDQSIWLDVLTGMPLVDGKTGVEQQAAAAARGTQFMSELLDAHESLTGIAEEHGTRTLADLMYLQQAILKGGFIDHYPDESAVLDIVSDLPSGETWATFVKIEEALPQVEADAAQLRLLAWHMRLQGVVESDLDDLVHDQLASHAASAVNNSGMEAQLEALLKHEGSFVDLLILLESELRGYTYATVSVRARIAGEALGHVEFDALPWLVCASYDELKRLAMSGSPEFRAAGLGLFDQAGEIALWCKDHGKTDAVDEKSHLRDFFEALEARDVPVPGKPCQTEINEYDFEQFAKALVEHYGEDARIL